MIPSEQDLEDLSWERVSVGTADHPTLFNRVANEQGRVRDD